MENYRKQLEQFLETHVPASQYMGIQPKEYDGKTLALCAPLEPNINDKQTAFGGSLYCVCVLSCWGMLYMKTLEKGITCEQVVTESNISYLAPVSGEIIATCKAPEESDLKTFFEKYEEKGRARLTLSSTIECEGNIAVKFQGSYAIRKI
ncbi:MAG: thioesterase domain-containing protein [Agarilytica sp.]